MNAKISSEESAELAKLVPRFDQFESWLEFAIADTSENKFLTDVFRKVVSDDDYGRLNSSNLIKKYPAIKALIGDENVKEFLEKLTGWKGQFDRFAGKKAVDVPTELIDDVQGMSIDGYQPILEEIDKYLTSLDRTAWEKSMEGEGDEIRLLLARQSSGASSVGIAEFRPALTTHALHVLDGEATVGTYKKSWNTLVDCLKPATQKAVARDIFNDLPKISITEDGAEHFLEIYDTIAKQLPLTTNADITLDQVLYPLMRGRTERSRTFIQERSNDIRTCFVNGTVEAQRRVLEALESLENSEGATANDWQTKLRGVLALESKPEALE